MKCCIGNLIEELNSALPRFMQHVSNIIHQHKELKTKKDELKTNEAVVHMAFQKIMSASTQKKYRPSILVVQMNKSVFTQ